MTNKSINQLQADLKALEQSPLPPHMKAAFKRSIERQIAAINKEDLTENIEVS